MRRLVLSACITVALVGVAPAVPAGASAGGQSSPPAPGVSDTAGNKIPSQYVVTLRDSAQVMAAADKLGRKYDADVEHLYERALHGFAARMSKSDAAAMARNPAVESVTQDVVVRAVDSQPSAPWGLDRVDQRDLPLNGVYNYATQGAVHAYIIDGGIRATHQDFGGRASVGIDTRPQDGQNGADCTTSGHGTHVAGTVGGSTYGIAKGVTLVAVRVLGCNGTGSASDVIAGVDWVTTNAIKPAVANMSLGTTGTWAPLDTAVQNSITSGVTYAVAAGNDNGNACSTSPAAAPNALTVAASSTTDARASFSNFGTCVDLFAPGVSVTSASNASNSATNVLSGTSMASPHVAGTAALYLSQNPGATPSQVATAINGNATTNHVSNPGAGSPNRLDYTGFVTGTPATAPAAPVLTVTAGNAPLHLSWTVPNNGGSPITGYKVFRGTSAGGELPAPLATLASNVTNYDDTMTVNGTTYYYQVAAVNAVGETRSNEQSAVASSPYTSVPQGDWVGAFGSQGYVLGAWNGSSNSVSTSDQVVLPAGTTFTLDQGARWCWTCPTTDVRGLESADQAQRRAGSWYHATQIRARLSFASAYSGTLRVYALDWDALGRRERVTVTDGSGSPPPPIDITTAFNQGAWLSFPINVGAGGTVNITVDKTTGSNNAVLAGVFLGEGAPFTPPPPPPPPYSSAPQGDWVGAFGSQGYVLGAWNGSSNSVSTSDQVVLPAGTTFTLDQGARWCWTCPTTDVRGLESADQAQRRAGSWYHATQIRARLSFASAYSGTLRVYALDWDALGRRERVTVTDGSGSPPPPIDITTAFNQGAWLSFPINVGAGGTVNITVDKTTGSNNAVLAGVFLGEGAPFTPPPPPPPPYSSAPQGDWVGAFGSQGYVLGAWNGSSNSVSTSDQVVLPAGTTFTLDQGARWCWTCPTTDVRGLESADQAQRRAGSWYHATQIRARLSFASAYSGTLRLYALDWDALGRRERVTVTDGSGSPPPPIDITTAFNQGAWLSFPINVGAGGTVNITVDKTTGSNNAVLAGVFLGEGAPFTPPPPPPPPGPLAPPPPVVGLPANSPSLPTPSILVSSLNKPWDIAFRPGATGPAGGMLYTENDAKTVSAYISSAMPRRVLLTENDVNTAGEGGMMGIAVHPTQPWVYVCFTSTAGGDNRVVRYTLTSDASGPASLASPVVVVSGMLKNSFHNGCRIRFHPGSNPPALFITMGDAGVGPSPQDANGLNGKVLRVDQDGNPYSGNASGKRWYTNGHRNPQGVAFRPADNAPWNAEHGTTINDEVNALTNGGNAGWDPNNGGGYDQSLPMTDLTKFPNAIRPKWRSGDSGTIAPSGLTFFQNIGGEDWKAWNGNVVLAVLKNKELRMLIVDGSGNVTGQVQIHSSPVRLRVPVIGPDGKLYVTTDENPGEIRVFDPS